MNGLEAVALMQQNKMVIKLGEDLVYKIMNNTVYYKELSGHDRKWVVEDNFSFSATYEEYTEKVTGWERVREREHYNVIKTKQQIVSCPEDGDGLDCELYEKANYFSTKEKAEEISFKQTLFRKLQRFSDENGSSGIDWKKDSKRKYFICYSSDNEELGYHWHYTAKHFGSVYFNSEETVQKAIELFHDDLIRCFTEDWDKTEKTLVKTEEK